MKDDMPIDRPKSTTNDQPTFPNPLVVMQGQRRELLHGLLPCPDLVQLHLRGHRLFSHHHPFRLERSLRLVRGALRGFASDFELEFLKVRWLLTIGSLLGGLPKHRGRLGHRRICSFCFYMWAAAGCEGVLITSTVVVLSLGVSALL